MARIYTITTAQNHIFEIYTGDRNHNRLVIHSNDMGKTIYETYNLYDVDVLKIIRVLEEEKYNYDDFHNILKKINKVCRHLKLNRVGDLIFDDHIFEIAGE